MRKKTGPTERTDETVVQPYTGMSDKSTFQMYKSNNKYKCYNIQMNGHKYLKPKKEVKKNISCIPLTGNYKRSKQY